MAYDSTFEIASAANEINMPKINVNDIAMYYEIHGQGEPLVCIGGFGVDHTTYLDLAARLKNHYQVIIYDNRGAGQTDVPPGPYSVEQMAQDVAKLCQLLKIEKAHFLGNSLGGYIAQMLAYQYPELVKSLIISNSVMKPDCAFRIYTKAQYELLEAQAPIASVFKAAASWAFSYGYLSRDHAIEDFIELRLQNPYPFTMIGYKAQLGAIESFDSRQWVNKINAPTLVIGSDQDLICLEAFVKQLAENIPHADYFRFEDCGHVPFIEYPEKFAEVVRDFLARN